MFNAKDKGASLYRDQYIEVLTTAAIALWKAGKRNDAIKYCSQVLAIDSKNQGAIEIKKMLEGESLLEIAMDPAAEEIREIANCIESKEFEKALDLCDQVLLRYPDSVAVTGIKAETLLRSLNQPEKALPYYKKLTELRPKDSWAWLGLGICYMKAESWDQMLTCDVNATTLDPLNANAWIGRGLALQNLGRFSEASDCFYKAYRIDPKPEYKNFQKQAKKNANKITSTRLFLRPIMPILLFIQFFEGDLYLYVSKNYSKAIETFETALKVSEILKHKKYTIRSLRSLARSYHFSRQYDRALNYSLEAIRLSKLIRNLRDEMDGCGLAGLAYQHMGKFEEAREMFQAALELSKKIHSKSNTRLFESFLKDVIDIAEYENYLISRHIAINHLSKDEQQSLGDLNNLNDPDEKKKIVKKLRPTLKAILDSLDLRDSMLALIAMGDICHSVNNNPASMILGNRFYVQYSGDPASKLILLHEHKEYPDEKSFDTFPFYRSALSIAERINDLWYQAYILLKLGFGGGTKEEILDYVERGLKVANQLNSRYFEGRFRLLLTLHKTAEISGLIQDENGIPTNSIKNALNYCDEFISAQFDDRLGVGLIYYIKGGLNLAIGDIKQVRQHTEKALSVISDEESSLEAWSLRILCSSQLAKVFEVLQDYHSMNKIQSEMLRYISYVEENFGWQIWSVYGGLLDFGETMPYQSLETQVEFIETVRSSVDETYRDSIVNDELRSKYHSAISVAVANAEYEKAIELIELTKTRNYTDILAKRNPLFGSAPSDLVSKYLKAAEFEQEKYSQYSSMSLQPHLSSETLNKEVQTLKLEWEEAKWQVSSLTEKLSAYRPGFSQPSVGEIIQYQQIVEMSRILDAAIIDFFVTGDVVLAFLILPSSEHPLFFEASINEINESDPLDRLYDDEVITLGNEIGAVLLNPIAQVLIENNTKRIILLPSQALHLLPLHTATYQLENKQKRLIDDFNIAFAPSASILYNCFQRSQNNQSANDELITITNSTGYVPFSNEEIYLVESLYTNKLSIQVGKRNEIAEMMKAIPSARYLHVCSHGNASGIYFGNSAQESTNQDTQDEGRIVIWSSETIEYYDLSAISLVILSSCESGVTDTGSGFRDEYIGLPSSFIVAGVPSVIASLWKVNGISTTLLMWKFHTNLINGLSIDGALRSAQLWLKNSSRADVAEFLKPLLLRNQTELNELADDDPRRNEFEKAFWDIQNTIFWLEDQDQYPFADSYWWAGFQVVGWPNRP